MKTKKDINIQEMIVPEKDISEEIVKLEAENKLLKSILEQLLKIELNYKEPSLSYFYGRDSKQE